MVFLELFFIANKFNTVLKVQLRFALVLQYFGSMCLHSVLLSTFFLFCSDNFQSLLQKICSLSKLFLIIHFSSLLLSLSGKALPMECETVITYLLELVFTVYFISLNVSVFIFYYIFIFSFIRFLKFLIPIFIFYVISVQC